MFEDYQLKTIDLKSKNETSEVECFLARLNLALDNDIEYCLGIYLNDRMVATGSLSGRVLKCIGVDPDFQGQNLLNKIVSALVTEAFHQGNEHLFIFTHPDNGWKFKELGFYQIAEVKPFVCLMENKIMGIQNYMNELRSYHVPGKNAAAIVMNCNPFTLGHRYLIETTARQNPVVYIFLVSEDRSLFPFSVREMLVREGTRDLENVVLIKGGDYIISQATFPSYFLKDISIDKTFEIHARLDVTVFGQYIAKTLNIKKRYVGEEPYCQVTRSYNKAMQEVLPPYGTEIIEIPRISGQEGFISASMVRKGIAASDFKKVRTLVPESTYRYLISPEAKPVIEVIKRHYLQKEGRNL